MTFQDSVVTGEPTIPTFAAEFVEEAPEEAEGPPILGIPRYLLRSV